MSQNKTIRIPASMILNSNIDNLTIITYAFLSVTKCSEPLNSFTVFHFCQFINKFITIRVLRKKTLEAKVLIFYIFEI